MKNKSSINNLKSHYLKVPSRLVTLKLNPSSLVVFLTCLTVTEDFEPSIKFIQERSGLGKNTVVRAFKELVDFGVLNKIETGSVRKVSKYEIVHPKDWKVKTQKTKGDQTEHDNEGQVKI